MNFATGLRGGREADVDYVCFSQDRRVFACVDNAGNAVVCSTQPLKKVGGLRYEADASPAEPAPSAKRGVACIAPYFSTNVAAVVFHERRSTIVFWDFAAPAGEPSPAAQLGFAAGSDATVTGYGQSIWNRSNPEQDAGSVRSPGVLRRIPLAGAVESVAFSTSEFMVVTTYPHLDADRTLTVFDLGVDNVKNLSGVTKLFEIPIMDNRFAAGGYSFVYTTQDGWTERLTAGFERTDEPQQDVWAELEQQVSELSDDDLEIVDAGAIAEARRHTGSRVVRFAAEDELVEAHSVGTGGDGAGGGLPRVGIPMCPRSMGRARLVKGRVENGCPPFACVSPDGLAAAVWTPAGCFVHLTYSLAPLLPQRGLARLSQTGCAPPPAAPVLRLPAFSSVYSSALSHCSYPSQCLADVTAAETREDSRKAAAQASFSCRLVVVTDATVSVFQLKHMPLFLSCFSEVKARESSFSWRSSLAEPTYSQVFSASIEHPGLAAFSLTLPYSQEEPPEPEVFLLSVDASLTVVKRNRSGNFDSECYTFPNE
ncbi:hypothetical protein DIPPA_04737 [Diplonema papillatum]|nr:hypothetical protein DIPPA_04737 [Diplonema papillatum]